jgi:hypothetical protein
MISSKLFDDRSLLLSCELGEVVSTAQRYGKEETWPLLLCLLAFKNIVQSF